MIAEIVVGLSVFLLLYYCFFGFYNYLYAFASLYTPKLKKVKSSNLKTAVVIVSFNEHHVIADTIRECEKLTYKNKVIIVGDDSTDTKTYPLLVKIAQKYGCKKLTDPILTGNGTRDVWESSKFVLFHRHSNHGYKAGHLKELETYFKAKGFDYMYLLDADWWPQKDAIERCTEVIEANDKLAFVQTKRVSYHGDMTPWEHCIALSEDGCYIVDLAGRQAIGDPILFTGCCTLFRLSQLYKAEGFTPGHMTEDIDLTNRFYLLGLKGAYLPDVENEGEVPPHYHALRSQQERWTMGTARTLKEYFWPIIKSNKLSIKEKLGQLRQNAYYSSAVAIELSVVLAVIAAMLSINPESIQGAAFQYYFSFIGMPYTVLIFLALASNFIAPIMVVIKRKEWRNLMYIPVSTWLSWSLLHTYFIANIKGFFNIKRDWSVTPKGTRKKIEHHRQYHYHIKFINLLTLVMLISVYGIEWYNLNVLDPFAFFWIPALVTGIFMS